MTIPIIDSVRDLAPRYDAWLCDIWGVVHNGLEASPGACKALESYRDAGGIVMLISNSPRPRHKVIEQMDGLGVPRSAYDGAITSGDATRRLLRAQEGQAVYHVGPERDLPIFDGIDVRRTDPASAALVLCSGLFDDMTETPADYTDLFADLRTRNLPMICANPDIQVEKGERLIYCAGSLAQAYEAAGGEVVYAGKPHRPIYDQALAMIAELADAAVPNARVLAIGDGPKTDMVGAGQAGLDALFVASGLHLQGHGAGATIDDALLTDLFADIAMRPVAAQTRLNW